MAWMPVGGCGGFVQPNHSALKWKIPNCRVENISVSGEWKLWVWLIGFDEQVHLQLEGGRGWRETKKKEEWRRKELDSDCGGLTAECRAQVCSLTPDTQCAPATSIETRILFMFHRVAHTCFLANNLQNITWGKWSLKRKTTMKAATHFPLCEGFPCAAGVWMKILEPAGDEEMSSFCLLSTNGRGRELLLPFYFLEEKAYHRCYTLLGRGRGNTLHPGGSKGTQADIVFMTTTCTGREGTPPSIRCTWQALVVVPSWWSPAVRQQVEPRPDGSTWQWSSLPVFDGDPDVRLC